MQKDALVCSMDIADFGQFKAKDKWVPLEKDKARHSKRKIALQGRKTWKPKRQTWQKYEQGWLNTDDSNLMKIGEKCCTSTRSSMYHYMVPKSVVSSFTGLLSKSNELAINHENKSTTNNLPLLIHDSSRKINTQSLSTWSSSMISPRLACSAGETSVTLWVCMKILLCPIHTGKENASNV